MSSASNVMKNCLSEKKGIAGKSVINVPTSYVILESSSFYMYVNLERISLHSLLIQCWMY